MLVRYWQPLREMETVRRQFDQLFDELTQPTQQQSAWRPAVEMKDNESAIVLRVQLPGIDAKDLDVEVTREAVTIAGEHRYEQKSEENGFFKSEFRYGKFHRVIGLPVEVQNDKVEADYKDGVLTLTLPKVEQLRHKAVKVNLASQASPTQISGAEVNADAN
ncbi:MAG: Hsp20/alpha crystallin family protein [Elainella sp.]